MEDEIYEDLKSSFEKTFGALRRELARVRSGRANVNLLWRTHGNFPGGFSSGSRAENDHDQALGKANA